MMASAGRGQGRPSTGMGHYLRDMVYGASDGVITTIAVVAGVSGAALPPAVAIILGVANLVADGISMGASNYLGLKSELEQEGRSVRAERPLRHGFATLAAFVGAGAIPLLAFLAPRGLPLGATPFHVALVLALGTLAAVGGARSRFLPRPAWACALEVLVVGTLAVTSAYAVGLAARAVFP